MCFFGAEETADAQGLAFFVSNLSHADVERAGRAPRQAFDSLVVPSETPAPRYVIAVNCESGTPAILWRVGRPRFLRAFAAKIRFALHFVGRQVLQQMRFILVVSSIDPLPAPR